MAKFFGFNLPFCEIAPFWTGTGHELLDVAGCGEQVRNDTSLSFCTTNSNLQCQIIWAMRNCFQGQDPEQPGAGLNFRDECELRDCSPQA